MQYEAPAIDQRIAVQAYLNDAKFCRELPQFCNGGIGSPPGDIAL